MIDQRNEAALPGRGATPIGGGAPVETAGARAVRKARTREAILEAAGRAFAARGFEGASLRAIAADADVGQPLLVYHFGSKEGVWRAAVDRLFGRVFRAVDTALAEKSHEAGDERLRVLLRSFIGVIAKEPAWLQILLREAAEPGPRLDWLVEHHSRATYRNGLSFLEDVRARGWLPPSLPIDHLLYALTGALGLVIAIGPEVERASGLDVHSEAFLDRHADTVFALLTSGRPIPLGDDASSAPV